MSGGDGGKGGGGRSQTSGERKNAHTSLGLHEGWKLIAATPLPTPLPCLWNRLWIWETASIASVLCSTASSSHRKDYRSCPSDILHVAGWGRLDDASYGSSMAEMITANALLSLPLNLTKIKQHRICGCRHCCGRVLLRVLP